MLICDGSSGANVFMIFFILVVKKSLNSLARETRSSVGGSGS